MRPDANGIAACAAETGNTAGFAISHRLAAPPDWLELLTLGVMFDLHGLAPGAPADSPLPAHAMLLSDNATRDLEALTVRPARPLTARSAPWPVLRALAALGCALGRLPGLIAIGWEPARTVMPAAYYNKVVATWLNGGSFPVLGLIALVRGDDGAFSSEGLALFIGHEAQVEPALGEIAADTAKFALRAINGLLDRGPPLAGSVIGPGGERLERNTALTLGRLRLSRGY